jgi:hypothetical protein
MRLRAQLWALLIALLSLAGCVSNNRLDRAEKVQIAKLTERARQHLQAQLGVRDEAIVVKSVRPLASLCYEQDTCTHRPGYVIELLADGRTYEYNARMLGNVWALWREI